MLQSISNAWDSFRFKLNLEEEVQDYDFKLENFNLNPYTLELKYNIREGFSYSLKESGKCRNNVMFQADFIRDSKKSFSIKQMKQLNDDIDNFYKVNIVKHGDNSFDVFWANTKPSCWKCCGARKKGGDENRLFIDDQSANANSPVVIHHNLSVASVTPLSKKVEQSVVVFHPQPIHESAAVESLKDHMRSEIAKHKLQTVALPLLSTSTLEFEDLLEVDVRINAFLKVTIEEKSDLCIFGNSGTGKTAYCWNKAEELLNARKEGEPIPWVIDCLEIDQPERAIDISFKKIANLKPVVQRQWLKAHCYFIFFFLNCDGCGVKTVANMSVKNKINDPNSDDCYKGKVIDVYRTQFIDHSDNYNILTYLAPLLDPQTPKEVSFEKLYVVPLALQDVREHFKSQGKGQELDYIQKAEGLNRLILIPFFLGAIQEVLFDFHVEKLAKPPEKGDVNVILEKILDKWIQRQMTKLKEAKYKFVEESLKRDVLDFCQRITPDMKANGGKIMGVNDRWDKPTPSQALIEQSHLRFCAPMGMDKKGAFVFFDNAFLDYFEALKVPEGTIVLRALENEHKSSDSP